MTLFPAPWNLNGRGYIALFKFSKTEIEKDRFLSEFFKERFAGGFASLMIVEYKDSNAGAYNEILLIPGKFRYKNKKKNTISKIFVSTMASVENGIRNWAIPKELADIRFTTIDNRTEQVTANIDGKEFFNARFKRFRFPFPVHTAFLPFPLVQLMDGKSYFTKFTGHGIGNLAKVCEISSNPEYFPDLSKKRFIAAIKLEPFNIVFPVAEVEES